MTKERPILFSGPMVRAILENRKTQTRRILKPQLSFDPAFDDGGRTAAGKPPAQEAFEQVLASCPYGHPGDRLWVREAFSNLALPAYPDCFVYRADGTHSDGDGIGCSLPDGCRWMPSIHMPRRACRIELEIVAVRIERLHDISEADSLAEGIKHTSCGHFGDDCFEWSPTEDAEDTAQEAYAALWKHINGDASWDANPWVWVVEFRRKEES